MPLDNLDDELAVASDYLAKNIAYFRLRRGMTQNGLAHFAGLPRSTVTHLESGNANPSLAHLLKLSAALHVTIEELLAAPRAECHLVRYADLPAEKRSQGNATLQHLLPDPLPGFEIDRLELAPKSAMKGNPHMPGTKEYFTCVQGLIEISVLGTTARLGEGDVFSFPGDQPHGYRNVGEKKAVGISVVAYAIRRTHPPVPFP